MRIRAEIGVLISEIRNFNWELSSILSGTVNAVDDRGIESNSKELERNLRYHRHANLHKRSRKLRASRENLA